MLKESLNRRTFLMGAAGLAAGVAIGPRARAQGDRLRIGIIGVGGQGEYSWSSLATEDVVMLCDVDLSRVAKAARQFPNAEVVQDFRRVLDRKDVDAVAVCTPDHWHAIPSVWAMQTGKHVYCEKPLARTVWETRVMAETARKQRRVTQMGTQIHAGTNYRRVVELLRSGAIGTVERVDVWCERRPDPGKKALEGTPPSTLDYDMWVGPASWRPYDPSVVPFNWRWWWDFGGGVLADMGCHYMDLPHWALELRHPVKVSAKGTEFPDADNKVPVELRVDYDYPARGEKPPVRLTWWHGIGGPRDAEGQVRSLGMRSGVLFHGKEGELLADYSRHRLLPEEKFKDFQPPAPSIPDSLGHHREWVNAIKNSGETTCNFDYSGALTETVLLGNIAYQVGPITWDAEELRIGGPGIKKSAWKPLLRPDYRGDWKLRR